MNVINYKLAGIISVILCIWSLFSNMYNLFFIIANAIGFTYVLLNLRDLLITRFQFNLLFSIAFYFVIISFLLGPVVVVLNIFIGGTIVFIIRGLGYLILGYFLINKWYQIGALLRSFIGLISIVGITQIYMGIWSFYPRVLLLFSAEGLKVYGVVNALAQFVMYILIGIILLKSTYVCIKGTKNDL